MAGMEGYDLVYGRCLWKTVQSCGRLCQADTRVKAAAIATGGDNSKPAALTN